ncbi:MAG: S8/S53 family peptidase [Euryarchaeota archaeon]|nr:S8/S53 family peptidase [Euryarchaeota archaeon]
MTRWVKPSVLAALLLAVALSGCTSDDTGSDEDDDPSEDPLDPLDQWNAYLADRAAGGSMLVPRIHDAGIEGERVVVAVIDSGVHAHHERFARPETFAPGTLDVAATDSATGLPPLYVPLPLLPGDDPDIVPEIVQPKTLYRFAGTNLLYYSVLDEVTALDPDGHGTATAGVVAENAPDATIVLVQTDTGFLEPAIEWAVAQPWIDIISVSWGCQANCAWYAPLAKSADPLDVEREIKATRAAWATGKLIVFSAGNDPTPHVTDYHDGPPWVVSVGGADPYRKGEAWMASKAPDVLANYTAIAPRSGTDDGYVAVPGTSFSAPVVAGALADAVLRLRSGTGHIGGIQDGALVAAGETTWRNSDVRDALNRTARYWTTTDHDPTADHPAQAPEDPLFALDAGVPINPAAPWLQMGWGYIDGTTGRAMAEGLMGGTLPDKPAEAHTYRDQVQSARETLWS